jgi:hypothetical protein
MRHNPIDSALAMEKHSYNFCASEQKIFAVINPHDYIGSVIDRVLSVDTTQRHERKTTTQEGLC